MKTILVTGGLGFIGSHTVVEILIKTKSRVIILDDMSNCFDDVLVRVKKIISETFSP